MATDAIRTTLKLKAYLVNSKRVFCLMKQMDLMGIFPKPNLSKANKEHKIFPYLLRERVIDKVNEAWSTDITYIRIRHGFFYLAGLTQPLCAELALIKHFRYVILS